MTADDEKVSGVGSIAAQGGVITIFTLTFSLYTIGQEPMVEQLLRHSSMSQFVKMVVETRTKGFLKQDVVENNPEI